ENLSVFHFQSCPESKHQRIAKRQMLKYSTIETDLSVMGISRSVNMVAHRNTATYRVRQIGNSEENTVCCCNCLFAVWQCVFLPSAHWLYLWEPASHLPQKENRSVFRAHHLCYKIPKKPKLLGLPRVHILSLILF